jgi:hypothetical protein
MPITLRGLNESWDSDTLNTVQLKSFPVVSPGAGVANTTVQTSVLLPFRYKIRKVSVIFSAIDAITGGSDAFNLVLGGVTGQTGQTYTQGNLAPNDNSQTGSSAVPGQNTGNLGYPTNFATAGQSVFAADVPFTFAGGGTYATGLSSTNTQNSGSGWISLTTSGGYGIFVPPNYDAVYPENVPLSLRVATTAVTGSITNLFVTIMIVPIAFRKGQTPISSTYYAAVPGVDY